MLINLRLAVGFACIFFGYDGRRSKMAIEGAKDFGDSVPRKVSPRAI